jgi:hypothetical protein
VWVKMGLWPFHRWLTYAHSLSPIANGWFFLTLMPNLGLYLLYRIQPLLANPVSLSPILRWLSLGTAAVLLYLYINQKSGDENRILIMAIHASLAVTFAAQQCLRVIPVMLYVSALRTSFPMVEKIERRVPRIILSGTIGCSNVIFWGATMLHENTVLPPTQVIFLGSILVCMSVWTFAHLYVGQFPLVSDRKEQVMLSTAGQRSEKFTKQISVTYQIGKKVQDWVVGMFELDVPEKLLSVVTLSVTNVSRWLYRIFEQNTLEKSVSSVAGGILAGGRWLYEVIEFASLEGFLRVIKRFIQALSLRLQRWHTGKLRLNLLWVVLCIVAAVLMLAM